jgi:hypothetical protein
MSCTTCNSRPKLTPFEKDFWYASWPCIFCGQCVCNQTATKTETCYVKHVREQHTSKVVSWR